MIHHKMTKTHTHTYIYIYIYIKERSKLDGRIITLLKANFVQSTHHYFPLCFLSNSEILRFRRLEEKTAKFHNFLPSKITSTKHYSYPAKSLIFYFLYFPSHFSPYLKVKDTHVRKGRDNRINLCGAPYLLCCVLYKSIIKL